MPITYLDDSPKITYLDDEQDQSSWKNNMETIARPVLEMGGAIGGSMLAGGPETPVGIAGGALGYGAGKSAADLLGRSIGVQQSIQNLPQAVSETAGNALQGAEMEATGLGLGAITKGIGSYAGPVMRRALGFIKPMLMNKPAREAANQAAQVAIENNIMPLLGSPEGAATNLEQLKNTTGTSLGAIRESVGSQKIDAISNQLELLRNKLTEGGAKGGEWDSLHQAIDTAQETISGLKQTGTDLGEVGLNQIEQAKKVITEGVNYLKQNMTQQTAKKIGEAIEDGVENILEAHGADMNKYQSLKRIYGGSSNALKALNNEVASQAGNQAINPMSVMVGTGALASGNPALAAESIGATEFLKRRGTGIGANILNAISKINPLWLKASSLGLISKEDQSQ